MPEMPHHERLPFGHQLTPREHEWFADAAHQLINDPGFETAAQEYEAITQHRESVRQSPFFRKLSDFSGPSPAHTPHSDTPESNQQPPQLDSTPPESARPVEAPNTADDTPDIVANDPIDPAYDLSDLPERSEKPKVSKLRRMIGGIALTAGLFTAASVAAGQPEHRAPLIDAQILRGEAAERPDILRSLGICATELKAQDALEHRQAGDTISRYEQTDMAITAQAIVTAENAQLPCVSSDGTETTTVMGQKVSRALLTIYKDTNWCDQRKEVTRAIPDPGGVNTGDIVTIGNQHFGWRCT